MKILFVNKVPPYPIVYGGTELFISEVAKRLSKKHQIHILCGKPYPINKMLLNKLDYNVKIHLINTWFSFLNLNDKLKFYGPRLLFYINLLPKLNEIIKKYEIDVVYDFVAPFPTLAPFVSELNDTPCIAQLWEFFGEKSFKNKGMCIGSILYITEHMLPKLPYTFYAVSSKDMCHLFLTRGGIPKEKTWYVRQGVDANKFRPGGKKEDNMLLTIGRFVYQKGHIYAIKAMKYIVQMFPKVKLMIIGDGPLKKDYIYFIRKMKLEKNISLINKLPTYSYINLLRRATLCIVPSLQECIPLTALEAMACGTPVIASDAPGVKEVVIAEETGLIFESENPEHLAEQVLKLLIDKEKRRLMGLNAREHVIANWTWENTARDIENLLLKIY